VLDHWLEAGMQGEMGWMEQHAAIRKDASLIEMEEAYQAAKAKEKRAQA
jgi:epoxyqueuosine reductase QueG